MDNRFLDLLLKYTDQLVAASNFTVVIFMSILAVICFYYVATLNFTKKTDLKLMLVGLGLEAIGWALHRFYWGLWRFAKLQDNSPWEKWFVDYGFLALIPSAIVMVGMVLIIAPIWSIVSDQTPHRKYFITGAFAFCVFWFFFWQIGLLDERIRASNPPHTLGLSRNLVQ